MSAAKYVYVRTECCSRTNDCQTRPDGQTTYAKIKMYTKLFSWIQNKYKMSETPCTCERIYLSIGQVQLFRVPSQDTMDIIIAITIIGPPGVESATTYVPTTELANTLFLLLLQYYADRQTDRSDEYSGSFTHMEREREREDCLVLTLASWI